VTLVDLRCPVTPRRLFAKIRMGEATIDRSDNTISVACDDCRSAMRRMGQDARLVVHTFTMLGVCIGTKVQR
jgi:hypothetical protein